MLVSSSLQWEKIFFFFACENILSAEKYHDFLFPVPSLPSLHPPCNRDVRRNVDWHLIHHRSQMVFPPPPRQKQWKQKHQIANWCRNETIWSACNKLTRGVRTFARKTSLLQRPKCCCCVDLKWITGSMEWSRVFLLDLKKDRITRAAATRCYETGGSCGFHMSLRWARTNEIKISPELVSDLNCPIEQLAHN